MTRSTRLLVLVLVSSGISFFLGLQFCHLTELFQISSIDIDANATDYNIARAPDKVIWRLLLQERLMKK